LPSHITFGIHFALSRSGTGKAEKRRTAMKPTKTNRNSKQLRNGTKLESQITLSKGSTPAQPPVVYLRYQFSQVTLHSV
jgi:hypothetical protein